MNAKNIDEACKNLAAALMDCLSLLAPEHHEESGPQLHSVADLAKRFEKSKDTIRRWIADGDFGEPVQTGNSVMVTEEGLQHYITAHSGPCQKRVAKVLNRRTALKSSAGRI